MTDGQKKVFDALRAYIAENGYSPSISELMVIIDSKSRNRVQMSLEALREEGLITWAKGMNRTLRLVSDDRELGSEPKGADTEHWRSGVA